MVAPAGFDIHSVLFRKSHLLSSPQCCLLGSKADAAMLVLCFVPAHEAEPQCLVTFRQVSRLMATVDSISLSGVTTPSLDISVCPRLSPRGLTLKSYIISSSVIGIICDPAPACTSKASWEGCLIKQDCCQPAALFSSRGNGPCSC